MCPPVWSADTQVGPYTRPTIDKRTRRLKRVALLSVIAFVLVVTGDVAQAQQPTKIPWIGYIGGSPAADSARIETLRQGLRELGFVEGKNFVIELRSAEEKLDRFPALAAELVRLKVDIILSSGALATRAGPITSVHLTQILEFAVKNRLAVMYPSRGIVETADL